MKQLLHIGTIELVSLPDDGILNVAAKIDTGADSSAIWASDIELKEGKLCFSFFAPGSAYYSGKRVETTAFKTTSVKNSFGHQEFRYKIRLKIKVGEHTLTRWFSLADRSRSTYPILLGKNFLKNKFVVDVACKYILSETVANSVLVLGGQPKLAADFFERVSKLNSSPVEYDCIDYGNLWFSMDNSHTQVLNIENQRDVAEYSLVYFKSHVKSSEFAAALAEYLQFKGRPFLDREVKQYMSASKLSEYMKLVCYDLPVPPTICAKTTVLKKSYAKVAHQLGVPFVLKEIFSDRGRNNYLIDNEADYTKILEQAEPDHTYIAQKYVDNDGFMRLYVLGKEVQLAILRTSHPHKEPLKRHLNKPAGGLNARKLKLDTVPSEVHDIAARAAMSLNRQVVGVDMIQDKTSKKWYILEANSAPQIRSGSNVDEKAAMIAHYFDKELNR